nr:MAG TPA: hypothetical protein [Caudoviricetes sp.]
MPAETATGSFYGIHGDVKRRNQSIFDWFRLFLLYRKLLSCKVKNALRRYATSSFLIYSRFNFLWVINAVMI